jgi:hypothetical protein
MTDEEINDMPWTSDLMTGAEFQEWVASRKAAGAAIDIAACELGRWYAYDDDPYCADPELPEEMKQIGTNRYVRSAASRGWVSERDLPPTTATAMYERIYDQARTMAAPAGMIPNSASGLRDLSETDELP